MESGLLYPGQDSLDATLRWGFVRKVYGIIAAQLVLTAIVAAVVVANSDVRHFMLAHWGIQVSRWCAERPTRCTRPPGALPGAGSSLAQPGPLLQVALLIVSMLGLIPLYIWRQSHPHNLLLLGLWTCLFSGGCAAPSRQHLALAALARLEPPSTWPGGLSPAHPPHLLPPICLPCSHGGHGRQLLPARHYTGGAGHHRSSGARRSLRLCKGAQRWNAMQNAALGCVLCAPASPHVLTVLRRRLSHMQVLGLTAYAFHATKRGVDFSFMGALPAAVWSALFL